MVTLAAVIGWGGWSVDRCHLLGTSVCGIRSVLFCFVLVFCCFIKEKLKTVRALAAGLPVDVAYGREFLYCIFMDYFIMWDSV